MVSISPERINKTSPYKVAAARNEYSVKFTTDYGVSYVVGFEYTDILSCTETYEFAITNLNQKNSPNDPKLRDTIMAVIFDFFLSSNTAMLYICETGDGDRPCAAGYSAIGQRQARDTGTSPYGLKA